MEKLKHQLTQQETLLSGYQQENERLYNHIKKEEVEKKTFESKMIKENQKLGRVLIFKFKKWFQESFDKF